MRRHTIIAALITLLLSGCALRDPAFQEYWKTERAPAMRAYDAEHPDLNDLEQSLRALPRRLRCCAG